jgi:hypothetical protein
MATDIAHASFSLLKKALHPAPHQRDMCNTANDIIQEHRQKSKPKKTLAQKTW